MKNLLFIPYQDADNFYSDGILTREFAMLYLLHNAGFNDKVINVKKPRTLLDKKKYNIKEEYYPIGTVEEKVKAILDNSVTVQYCPILSIRQVLHKRAWWALGYEKTKSLIHTPSGDNLVYSDNPFASALLQELHNQGCKLYFDIMDNFAIHPSLRSGERKQAYEGYRRILEFADIVSANSKQTREYIKERFGKEVILLKNGVFADNAIAIENQPDELRKFKELKIRYRKCIGYIGKLGKRLNADLIESVSKECGDSLFVFIGDNLKDQLNDKLLRLFEENRNVLHLNGIPSAYVYAALNEFDILMIPHAVGKAENGGDSLKLYQYLVTGKPIITTPILGVDEFKDFICISNDARGWIKSIKENRLQSIHSFPSSITWENRSSQILNTVIKLFGN